MYIFIYRFGSQKIPDLKILHRECIHRQKPPKYIRPVSKIFLPARLERRIMGTQLRGPLEPLNTVVLCCTGVVTGGP